MHGPFVLYGEDIVHSTVPLAISGYTSAATVSMNSLVAIVQPTASVAISVHPTTSYHNSAVRLERQCIGVAARHSQ